MWHQANMNRLESRLRSPGYLKPVTRACRQSKSGTGAPASSLRNAENLVDCDVRRYLVHNKQRLSRKVADEVCFASAEAEPELESRRFSKYAQGDHHAKPDMNVQARRRCNDLGKAGDWLLRKIGSI